MQRTGECRTDPNYLPTEADLASARDEPYFILGAYDDDLPDILEMIFLQRLRLPMVVDSERARREIALPDLASVHRWAATEFYQYEVDQL